MFSGENAEFQCTAEGDTKDVVWKNHWTYNSVRTSDCHINSTLCAHSVTQLNNDMQIECCTEGTSVSNEECAVATLVVKSCKYDNACVGAWHKIAQFLILYSYGVC